MDGRANEATTVELDNNRNGKPTSDEKAKAKAKAEKAAKRKAARAAKAKRDKKAKGKGFELITVVFNGKKTGFLYCEGLNLKDFTAKNLPLLGQLTREQGQAVLNKVCNAYMLTTGRFESVKVNGTKGFYDKASDAYRARVAMSAILRREITPTEEKEAFEADETRFLKSIADRRAVLQHSK